MKAVTQKICVEIFQQASKNSSKTSNPIPGNLDPQLNVKSNIHLYQHINHRAVEFEISIS